MKPDKTENGKYLFKVMNLHKGAGVSVEETLWSVLPRLSACRQAELEWLEELLSLFVDRMIQAADLALLTLLEYPGDYVPEHACAEIIESFLEKTMAELGQIHTLYLETVLLRLNRGYSSWAEQHPPGAAGRPLAGVYIYDQEEHFLEKTWPGRQVTPQVKSIPAESRKPRQEISRDSIRYFERLRSGHLRMQRQAGRIDFSAFHSGTREEEKGDE